MPDVEFSGEGVYTVWGNNPAARNWLRRMVSFEPWQGNPLDGVCIDGIAMAQRIAAAALKDGFVVEVNGKKCTGF